MKNKDFDSTVRNFVEKNLSVLVVGFLLLFSAVIRLHLMKHGSSGDFERDISPWIESFRNSPKAAFREGFVDYYIPYTVILAIISMFDVPVFYSVGIVSCIFDYLTAFYIFKLLDKNFSLSKEIAALVGIAYLFLPTIALNSAAWKQCDSIYAFFIVVCLKCLFDEKIRTAFIMLGIAFSFKLQTILIVPMLLILYLVNKKIKLLYWGYVILVYLITGLPAIIAGRPVKEVYSIYLAQADEYHVMTMYYPNMYMVALSDYEKFHIYAKLLTICVLALTLWYICSKVRTLSQKGIMGLSVWSVWTCCMFLPSMHQRYDYLVAVLLIVCVAVFYNEKPWAIIASAILFYLGNLITYSISLYGADYSPVFVMCCNMAAYALFGYVFWNFVVERRN